MNVYTVKVRRLQTTEFTVEAANWEEAEAQAQIYPEDIIWEDDDDDTIEVELEEGEEP